MYNVVPYVFRKRNTELGSLLDRVFEEFFDFGPRTMATHAWSPPIDFYEDESSYKLSLEIPGVTKDNIDISLENNVLTVSGEKKQEQAGDGRRMERVYGSFTRSFSVPESADREKIAAKFDNGVLTVTVPKLPTKAAQKIMIE